jgi:hypothetical protein
VRNRIAETQVKLRRRIGELLAPILQHGARGVGKKVKLPKGTSLSDVGITKKMSSQCQTIASIPEDVFVQHVATVVDSHKELTRADTLPISVSILVALFRNRRGRDRPQ